MNLMLTTTEAFSLTGLVLTSFAIIHNTLRGEGDPIYVSFALSLIGFAATFALIRWLGQVFMDAGLKGRDRSKRKQADIPEAMGLIAAVVYVLMIIVFIPFPFYKDIVEATSESGQVPAKNVEMGRYLQRFPHSILALYLSSLLSLQAIIILGLGDDLFDIRWRHKVFIPALAAIPMLIVYFVDFGVTHVVVPIALQRYLGQFIDLGWMYYVYMAAISIFCPNSINMLAGINGIEVAQSLVIAVLLIANDALYLPPITPYPHPATESHLFSTYLLIPFIGVSLALLYHNWYPAQVFVGDTYCYFAGMVFAVVGILGHFSKTLLLLFIPQIFNFLFSCPQLFHIIPCPRHRMPHFNHRTGLLEPSATPWRTPPPWPISHVLELFAVFRLVKLGREPDGNSIDDWQLQQESRTKQPRRASITNAVPAHKRTHSRKASLPEPDMISLTKWSEPLVDNGHGAIIQSTNMTLPNLLLVWFGPMREDALARMVVVTQLLCGIIGLLSRHWLGKYVFAEDNRGFRSFSLQSYLEFLHYKAIRGERLWK